MVRIDTDLLQVFTITHSIHQEIGLYYKNRDHPYKGWPLIFYIH